MKQDKDYIKDNKAAWEEAFEHRHLKFGENNYQVLMQEELPFFVKTLHVSLEQ